jgi:hypothetical protein
MNASPTTTYHEISGRRHTGPTPNTYLDPYVVAYPGPWAGTGTG